MAFPGWGLAGLALWVVSFGASFAAYTMEVGTAWLPVSVAFALVLLGAVAGADRWVHRNSDD